MFSPKINYEIMMNSCWAFLTLHFNRYNNFQLMSGMLRVTLIWSSSLKKTENCEIYPEEEDKPVLWQSWNYYLVELVLLLRVHLVSDGNNY